LFLFQLLPLLLLRLGGGLLGHLDVVALFALYAFGEVKLHLIALVQLTEPRSDYPRVMDKIILPILTG